MRKNKLYFLLIILSAVFLFSSLVLLNGCIGRHESDVILEEEKTEVEGDKEAVEAEIKDDEKVVEEEKEKPEEETKTEDETVAELEDPRVYAAILKSLDLNNNLIEIEQLINEPGERVLDPELKLATDLKVYKIVVVRDEDGESEYTREILLKEIPSGVEIGIKLKGNLVSKIIYSEIVEANGPQVQEIRPLEGEYFVYAILKSKGDNLIVVDQLINEPNEKIIDPEVRLAEGFKVYRSILIRTEDSEKQYTKEISLKDVATETEIGIVFTKDNLARTIISFEMFEG